MRLVVYIIILVITLIVLLFSGDRFVDSSVNIAKKFKISPAVIGATFVSLGTALPEILVTIFSIKENSGGIAVGNAVGSIIFNCALIGGVLFIFSKEMKKKRDFSTIILLFSILLLLIMCLNGILNLMESILLILVFVSFIVYNYIEIRKEKVLDNRNEKQINIKKEILIFILSAIGIGFSAYFMVEAAKNIGTILKISDTIIGLIVVAIGTSLPELITTITSIKKNESSLGIGNIIGSNIINCTLLVGLTGLFAKCGLIIDKETILISIPLCLLCASLLLITIYAKRKKIFGIILLTSYAFYYLYLILSATQIISI